MPQRKLPAGSLAWCPRCESILYAYVLADGELQAACTACRLLFVPAPPEPAAAPAPPEPRPCCTPTACTDHPL